MNLNKKILTFFTLLILMGCNEKQSPSSVYEKYNARVISGISFEQEKTYYSIRKIKEVEDSIPRYMEQMKKSKNEVIEFYTNFTQSQAKCKQISLVNEEMTSSGAILTYSQKDICSSESKQQEKQVINMVNENGWKIDDIEIVFYGAQ